jgi:hypothetical protein
MLTLRISGALLAAAALAGCSNPSDPTSPAAASGPRNTALHAAAECLRQHGVEHFADPVLGANGQVFTDIRGLEGAKDAADAAKNACRRELGAANWNPKEQPPAPAALVAAGVKAARCMRAHGLPDYKDPTATSRYTPGHGFSIQPGDLPPGADKRSPTVQQAAQACRSLLDAEVETSRLDRLAGK